MTARDIALDKVRNIGIMAHIDAIWPFPVIIPEPIIPGPIALGPVIWPPIIPGPIIPDGVPESPWALAVVTMTAKASPHNPAINGLRILISLSDLVVICNAASDKTLMFINKWSSDTKFRAATLPH